MSNYTVAIKNSAKADLGRVKQTSLEKQLEEVIQTLKEDPYMPTQSFEELRPTHEGRCSHRPNRQHRVVYRADEEGKVVEIYSVWTHYE